MILTSRLIIKQIESKLIQDSFIKTFQKFKEPDMLEDIYLKSNIISMLKSFFIQRKQYLLWKNKFFGMTLMLFVISVQISYAQTSTSRWLLLWTPNTEEDISYYKMFILIV